MAQYQPPSDWWERMSGYLRGETSVNPLTGEDDNEREQLEQAELRRRSDSYKRIYDTYLLQMPSSDPLNSAVWGEWQHAMWTLSVAMRRLRLRINGFQDWADA